MIIKQFNNNNRISILTIMSLHRYLQMYIYILFNFDKFPMIVIISYSHMRNVLPIKYF